jgi:hypothetical protein
MSHIIGTYLGLLRPSVLLHPELAGAHDVLKRDEGVGVVLIAAEVLASGTRSALTYRQCRLSC